MEICQNKFNIIGIKMWMLNSHWNGRHRHIDYIRQIHVPSMHTNNEHTKIKYCALVCEFRNEISHFFRAQTSDRRYNVHRTCFISLYKWYYASIKSTTQLNYALGRFAFDGSAMADLSYSHFDNKNWLLCALVKFHLNISFWPMCWAAYGSSSQTSKIQGFIVYKK